MSIFKPIVIALTFLCVFKGAYTQVNTTYFGDWGVVLDSDYDEGNYMGLDQVKDGFIISARNQSQIPPASWQITSPSATSGGGAFNRYSWNGNLLESYSLPVNLMPTDVWGDQNGNIYFYIFASGNVDIDPTPAVNILQAPPSVAAGHLLIKYNINTGLQWGQYIYEELSVYRNYEFSGGILVSGNEQGHLYTATHLPLNGGYLDSDPGPAVSTLNSGDMLISRFDTLGTRAWDITVGGSGNIVRTFEMETAPNGDLIILGGFIGSIDFDPGPGTTMLTGTGNVNTPSGFLARYDPNGQLVYAIQPPFNSAMELVPQLISGYHFAMDPGSNIYFGGKSSGNSLGICRVSPTGIIDWQHTFSGDRIFDLTYSPDQKIVVSHRDNNSIYHYWYDLFGNYLSGTGYGSPSCFGGHHNPLVFETVIDTSRALIATGLFRNILGNPLPPPCNPCGFSVAGNSILANTNSNCLNHNYYSAKLSPNSPNEITGTVYQDANRNGAKDTGEIPLPNVVLNLGGANSLGISAPNGEYNFSRNAGSWTISPWAIPFSYDTIQPVSHSATFTGTWGQIDSLNDFGIHVLPGVRDLFVNQSIRPFMRPGGNAYQNIQVWNYGTDTLSGQIAATFPPDLIYQSASVTPASISGNQVLFNFSNLLPFTANNLHIDYAVDTAAQLGTIGTFTALGTITGDINLSNNQDTITSLVTAAYDPNIKIATPQEAYEQDFNNDPVIDYEIHFQNTGTDTAFRVRIVDTLSPLLNTQTLQIVGARHPFTVNFQDNNVLVWEFDPIRLPDSTTNEPESKGFVKFRIEAQPGFQHGDTIFNRAAIYFDYQMPVITDWAYTTLDKFDLSSSFFNPTCYQGMDGQISVSSIGTSASLQYSIDGVNFQNNSTFSNLSAGVYWLFARDPQGVLDSIQVTLTAPDRPYLTATTPEPTCPGEANGSLILQSQGGQGPVTYSYNGTLYNDGDLISNLASGDHFIDMIDSSGCIFPETVTVSSFPPVQVSVNFMNSTGSDGSIILLPTSGTSPFIFMLDTFPSNSTGIYQNLSPGIYNFTVTDSNGCSFTDSIEIELIIGVEANREVGVNVFPNPTTGRLAFQFEADWIGETTVDIVDLHGRVLLNQKWNLDQGKRRIIDLPPSLAKGIYFVQISSRENEQRILIRLNR